MFIMTLMLCTTKIRRERIWLLALYNTTLSFFYKNGIQVDVFLMPFDDFSLCVPNGLLENEQHIFFFIFGTI